MQKVHEPRASLGEQVSQHEMAGDAVMAVTAVTGAFLPPCPLSDQLFVFCKTPTHYSAYFNVNMDEVIDECY